MRHTLPLWLLLGACSGPDPVDDGPPPAPAPEVVVDPGSKPLHRMNRAELDNTFRDLFGTELTPARDLPDDETTYGFDNIAEGLTLGSVHVELIEGGIDSVLDEFFGRHPESTELESVEGEGPGTTFSGGEPYEDWAYQITEEDEAVVAVMHAEHDGLYRVGAMAFGSGLYGEPVQLHITVGDQVVGDFPLVWGEFDPKMIDGQIELDEGWHTITLSIANPEVDDQTGQRRSIGIDYIELEGPLDPERGPSDAYPTLVRCDPVELGEEACARQVLTDFARLAWRRPLTEDELEPYVGLFGQALDAELPWDESLQLAMKGVLMSPDFVYRVEADSDEARPLDGYELAARLSYFLWSSTPDEALLVAAEDGSLVDPEVTAWHVRRMLEDPKAHALVDNFTGQWWDIRGIEHLSPDPTLYGNWDDALRHSMEREMLLLAEDYILGGRDLRQVLDSNETRMDARLAAHYGLPAPANDWDRVTLDGTPRAGLLGTAGWLASQAHPDRPSPVRRGRWILDNLLCAPPPPPPPNAEGLQIPDPILGSVRAQEESRRADEYCQSCHERMDPMGFSLGHFDAIGGLRAVDELGYPIDGSGLLPDGTQVRSVVELTPWLATDPRVPSCMVEQTLTYALGRPMGSTDATIVADIEQQFLAAGGTFDALAQAIAASPAFRMRAPADASEEDAP